MGYSWIDGLKEHAERLVSDDAMQTMGVRFPHNTPHTKEAAYFRTIFHSHFPNNQYGNGTREQSSGGSQPTHRGSPHAPRTPRAKKRGEVLRSGVRCCVRRH